MKKIKYIYFLIFVFCFPMFVQAKDVEMTCDYLGTRNTSSGSQNIALRCVVYDNYSHQCYLEFGKQVASNNGNKESILNWTDKIGGDLSDEWTSKKYVEDNHKCLPYIIFNGDFVYKLYGADTEKRKNDIYSYLNNDGYILSLSKEYMSTDGENSYQGNEEPDYKIDDSTNIKSICAMPEYRKPMRFIGIIVNFLKIIIPILIILFGALDLYKAMTSSKDDGWKKALKSIAIRVIAGVFIFLLPGIIQMVLNMVNEWSDYENTWCCCTDCLLNGDCNVNSCNSKTCHIEGTD